MTATDSPIRFSMNGREIEARPAESILQAASRHGISIPQLCYKPGYPAQGACRSCMVEIEGERVLAASCCRQPQPGMVVNSASQRALQSQKMVLELLASNGVPAAVEEVSELHHWCREMGITSSRFQQTGSVANDLSHPAISVNLDECIQCFRCVRACRDIQVNDVIGIAGRGADTSIVFDQSDALGSSSCVACGECVQACPTSALIAKDLQPESATDQPVQQVNSACPYCGVGCLLTYRVRGNRILRVDGRDGPSNRGRLCVKGRFGFDYVHHHGRLTRPLIRREDAVKTAALIPPDEMMRHFREASWDEALEAAANGFTDIRQQYGGQALAGFGSAKGSNEEAYLFQKLIRTGFGSNNVDHCTRLCHASSVAALLEGIGSGAVSNQVADVDKAEVIIVIGAKPTVNHPVAATFMKNAVKQGTSLIVLDPNRSELSRHARYHLQFRPDTDVPLLNAMMQCIIEEALYDQTFIDQRTEGFEALADNVRRYTPEAVEPICGIKADTLRRVARLYATSAASMIFWGMGISQHVHGTDNARCLIALALLTGQIGREGTGLHPLRGQNNVQGASDVGLIPMMYPGYRRVDDNTAWQDFTKLWQCNELDHNPGLTVVETLNAAHSGDLRGMYIMGENPAMSDPNLNHARAALSKLKHLVVQEIFFTETAGYADVILPATAFPEKTGTFTNTDRRVQLGRQAIQPPGEARQDLSIIQSIAQRMGLPWNYAGPEAVFEEIRTALPAVAGISWSRLEQVHSLTYPLLQEGDSGMPTLFQDTFPTASGKARFVSAHYRHADELPDSDYPLVFTTGRQLEHWHTGSMTRRATILDALEPQPVISMHPHDAQLHQLIAGDQACVESRRGSISATVRLDDGIQPGCLFMAFCYHDAAANLLTNEALDPDAKIPGFKYCAVRIRAQGATQ